MGKYNRHPGIHTSAVSRLNLHEATIRGRFQVDDSAVVEWRNQSLICLKMKKNCFFLLLLPKNKTKQSVLMELEREREKIADTRRTFTLELATKVVRPAGGRLSSVLNHSIMWASYKEIIRGNLMNVRVTNSSRRRRRRRRDRNIKKEEVEERAGLYFSFFKFWNVQNSNLEKSIYIVVSA